MENLENHPVRVGAFTIVAQRNMIERNDVETFVEPKVMDVLCFLIDRKDTVLSRDEIINNVWSDAPGGDERLTRAISQLRKAFGDDSRNPAYIETVSKRGYRLLADVSPVRLDEETSSASEPAIELPQLERSFHVGPVYLAGIGLIAIVFLMLLVSAVRS